MLTTQEFADICRTSKRTIIHYDRIGLLKPKQLRGTHRLYMPQQLLTFQKISLLKSFGVTLNEAKLYLTSDRKFNRLFEEKLASLNNQKRSLEINIEKLEGYLENITNNKPLINPEIKDIKSYSIYAINRTGKYVDIGKFERELAQLLDDKNFSHTYLAIYNDEEFKPEKSNITIGAISENKTGTSNNIKQIEVKNYKALYYRYVGPYSHLSYIWQYLNKYISDNNIKKDPNNKEREIYIKNGFNTLNKDECITDIHIPILT